MKWQYFLGCKVKCKGFKQKGILSGVYPDCETGKEWELMVTFKNEGKSWNRTKRLDSKDCKPILRPLSSMTDDEKREFNKMFFVPKKRAVKFEIYAEIIRVTMLPNPEVFRSEVEKIYDKSFPTTGICTVKEVLWLMEKGFYVNQCELSECIIEEV